MGIGDSSIGRTATRTVAFNLLDNVVTTGDFTKDGVLTVQPWAWNSGDEELGTVGVWTSVSHGQQTWLGVLQGEVFIGKFFTVDGLTTGTVVTSEVTTLQHELWDDSVESRTFVTETLFTGTQSSEVFSSLWDNVGGQFENNLTGWLTYITAVSKTILTILANNSNSNCKREWDIITYR